MKRLIVSVFALGFIGVIANPVSKQTIQSEHKYSPQAESSDSQTKHEEVINTIDKGEQEQKKDTLLIENLQSPNIMSDKDDATLEIIIEAQRLEATDDSSKNSEQDQKNDKSTENPDLSKNVNEKVEIIIEENVEEPTEDNLKSQGGFASIPAFLGNPQLPEFNAEETQLPGAINSPLSAQFPGFFEGLQITRDYAGVPQIPAFVAENPQLPSLIEDIPKIPAFVTENPQLPSLIEDIPQIPAFVAENPQLPSLIEDIPKMPAFVAENPQLPSLIEDMPQIPDIRLPGLVDDSPQYPSFMGGIQQLPGFLENYPGSIESDEDNMVIDKEYFQDDMQKVEHEIMETAAGFVPTPLVFRKKQKPRRRFAIRRHFRRNPYRRHQMVHLYPYSYYAFYRPSSLRYY